MPRKRNTLAFDQFNSRKYINSFGRSSKNTWHELPEQTRQRLRDILEKRDGLICCSKYGDGCGHEFKSTELSVDHIIPIRAGGPIMDLGNIQLLCFKCHDKKTMTKDIKYSNSFRYFYLRIKR